MYGCESPTLTYLVPGAIADTTKRTAPEEEDDILLLVPWGDNLCGDSGAFGDRTMTDGIQTDDCDGDVLDSLDPEEIYRGYEIRDRYREETRIRGDARAKARAKQLTHSSLFNKISWGRWQFTGEQQ